MSRLKPTKEKRREYNQRFNQKYPGYRSKRNGALRIKKMVWLHQQLGGVCALCGIEQKLEIHHLVAKPKGSKTTSWTTYLREYREGEPLLLLCKKHHRMVHSEGRDDPESRAIQNLKESDNNRNRYRNL